MTCQHLWEIGREHIYRQIAAEIVGHLWSGDRILCIGDDLDNKDIPKTLFTQSERAEFLHPKYNLWDYPFKKTEPKFDRHILLSMSGFYRGFRSAQGRSKLELRIITDLFDIRAARTDAAGHLGAA
ncbi:hypothetical protein B0H19DRAFT_1375669 [Mycena capillaripes]|nr:hypothetical protein B0H19DRAFT_1375669 [Mycena capillaripes]